MQGGALFIFIDESGDLGFDFTKGKTSRFFVITGLYCTHKRPIENSVSAVHAGLRKKQRKPNTLHSFQEKPITRRRLLCRLSELECGILSVRLDKTKVKSGWQNRPKELYNFLAKELMAEVFAKHNMTDVTKVTVIASRRETNRWLNNNFVNYLAQGQRNIEVVIKKPFEEKGLQAVDFVSWALFRKYEYADNSYRTLVKSRLDKEVLISL